MVRESLTRAHLALLAVCITLAGCAGPRPQADAEPPPAPREFRAAWVASVANIDWPSRRGLSSAEQQEEIARIVERAQAIGFRLGIGGCVTYGHAELDEAVRSAPDDMLVLETDSPYLEPEPRSLKRNEPSLLTRVVRRLCELRDWTPEQAVEITRRNARELFRMPLG